MDITIALLWQHFVSDGAGQPHFRAAFLAWVAVNRAEEWAKFAASRGRAVDDPELVVDAALATSRLVSEAIRLELDRLTAILEVREALGEL
jgi:hypothetical protein